MSNPQWITLHVAWQIVLDYIILYDMILYSGFLKKCRKVQYYSIPHCLIRMHNNSVWIWMSILLCIIYILFSHMFSCFGSYGSNGFLFSYGCLHWFSVLELKVPMVPYLDMGGSNGLMFGS